MSYGINFGGSPLQHYDAAVARYERTKPWNNSRLQHYRRELFEGPNGKRPLDSRTKRHMTMRRLDDGSISCELYNTDVVTYHPDGRISLEGWDSMSTDQFANTLLRGTGVRTCFNTGTTRRHNNGHGVMHVYFAHREGQRGYRLDDHGMLTLQPVGGHWQVDEDATKPLTFEKLYIDRKLARAALAAYPHYPDFVHWSDGVGALNGSAPLPHKVFGYNRYGSPDRVGQRIPPAQWLAIVSDRELWPRLLSQTYHPAHEWGRCVRDAAYRVHEVVKTLELPYIEGWREYDAMKRSHRLLEEYQ